MNENLEFAITPYEQAGRRSSLEEAVRGNN